MSKSHIAIQNRKIGPNHPPYIIAELSANHNGSLDKALETISMAKQNGADAIKIQSYTADTMTIDCEHEDFKISGGLWDGYSLYQLYQQAHTPFEWHKTIFEHAKSIGITVFSSPFDETAVDLLEELDTPAYKIASFELTDLPLIDYIAQTGKPIIMSTGMANEEEIAQAVDTARNAGCQSIILLHCISAYPAPPEESNLKTISDLAEKFDVISGLSDHTIGDTVAIASVSLGACVIEKHVTLSRKDKGPDSEFSIEPNELAHLCRESKIAWQSLGKAGYDTKKSELANRRFRRSLYFVMDITAGEIITKKHIRRIRPGFGLAPKYYDNVIGQTVRKDIKRGTAVAWELLNEPLTSYKD